MLFDAMDTPPQCLQYLEGDGLKDDCDGFHSAIYWLIKTIADDTYDHRIITIVTKPFWKSHTMCTFKLKGKMYLVDYNSVIEVSSYYDILNNVDNSVYWHLNTWDGKWKNACE